LIPIFDSDHIAFTMTKIQSLLLSQEHLALKLRRNIKFGN